MDKKRQAIDLSIAPKKLTSRGDTLVVVSAIVLAFLALYMSFQDLVREYELYKRQITSREEQVNGLTQELQNLSDASASQSGRGAGDGNWGDAWLKESEIIKNEKVSGRLEDLLNYSSGDFSINLVRLEKNTMSFNALADKAALNEQLGLINNELNKTGISGSAVYIRRLTDNKYEIKITGH